MTISQQYLYNSTHPRVHGLRLVALLLCLVAMVDTASAQRIRRANRPLLKPSQNYYGSRFFPALKWRLTLGMAVDTAPAAADLDLDGTMDLVVPVVDGDRLYRLNDNGDVKWKVPLPAPATAGVALGDVNRDGTLDIILAAEKYLLCYTPEGAEQWRVQLSEEIKSFPTIADIDGDGQAEVLVGANDNKLHVYNSKGQERWSFETKSWIVGGVALGDLDGDGKLEIVFGSMDFNIYCLDSTGKPRWTYETEDWVQSSPVIADVDRDGGLDIISASDDGELYCLSRRGTLKWKETLSAAQRMKPYLVVADLDGEGTFETVVCLPDGNMMAFTAFGDRAWTARIGAVLGSPLVADLNGDGWQDILAATKDGQLTSVNTWGSQQWSIGLGQTVESSPLIGDFDRDGKYEIYVANLMASNRNSGFFSQFEISVAGGKGVWASLKGDPYRTGSSANAIDFGTVAARGYDYATAWEPFGIGYRPRTGTQPPRRLRITALPLQDVNGNRDGALDPGETALFWVRVVNLGKGPSYDSTLRLTLKDSPLRLDRTRTYLGRIAPGATKTVLFRLTAPPLAQLIDYMTREATFREVAETQPAPVVAAPSGAKVINPKAPLPIQPARIRKLPAAKMQAVKIEVLESGVQAGVAEAKVFNVPPLPPVIRAVRRQIIDNVGTLTFGNGNGQLDSGETVVLRLLLRNDNLTTAKTATATLTTNSSDVLTATPMAQLREVVPYGGRQVDFSLRLARQLKEKTVTLTLKTQATTTQSGVAPAHVEQIVLPLRQGGVDAVAPTITLASPPTRIASTTRASYTISGVVSDVSDLSAFSFEQAPVPITKLRRIGPNRYRFAFARNLEVGENVFPINATDTAGNSVTLWTRIVRKPVATKALTKAKPQTKKSTPKPTVSTPKRPR